jgi:PKD repeat protein
MKTKVAVLLVAFCLIGGGLGINAQEQPLGIIVEPKELEIDVWVDKEVYLVGDEVRIFFKVNQDAYVYMINIDAAGMTRLVFPNRFSQDNFVRAGEHVLPEPGKPYRFVVVPPAGTEFIQAIASTEPLELDLEFVEAFPPLGSPKQAKEKMEVAIEGIAPVADIATDWTSFEVVIHPVLNRPPVARFTYSPTSPLAGERVLFDASASYDPDGYITRYEWDFNNDSRIDARGVRVTYTFHVAGLYPVTLTVTDNKGRSSYLTQSVRVGQVTNRPPVANFTFSPTEPRPSERVFFDASMSYDPDPGDYITRYEWDFNSDGFIDAHGRQVTYIFHRPGLYHVTLKVTDRRTASDSITKTVSVQPVNQPPIADFTYFPTHPRLSETVFFDASASYDPDGHIVHYAWDFNGDSITDAYGVRASYTFYRAGWYHVTLTVTDNVGATDSITKTVNVRFVPTAKPGFYINTEDNILRITVQGSPTWFFPHRFEIFLETDGTFRRVERRAMGEAVPLGIVPVPHDNTLTLTGSVTTGRVDYYIRVSPDATKIKFDLRMDIDGDGILERRRDFVYLGPELKNPPSMPFVIGFEPGRLIWWELRICVVLVDQPGFRFMICFNWRDL